jgi:hypothetical protein
MQRQLSFAALALGVVLATPAASQQFGARCAPRDTVVAYLADRYGESRQSIGIAAGYAVMELYASGETGTWTVTVTLPDGMMCLVASGSSFETVAEAPVKPGDDA